MTTLALVLIVAGGFIVWSVVAGANPLDVWRSVLTGRPIGAGDAPA